MSTVTCRKHPELPLYLLEADALAVYYAPGYICLPASSRGEPSQNTSSGGDALPSPDPWQVPSELIAAARQAQDSRQRQALEKFVPECLTVCLSNACNLDCGYCYSAGSRNGNCEIVQGEVVAAAARLVVQCCKAKQKAFQLVIHGGGEPTIHFPLVQEVVEMTRRIADDSGILWRAHLATNGVLPAAATRWLARHFDTIGLSCDGPPEIHDRYRRWPGGEGSYTEVAQTARVLADAGTRVVVRTTILPQTLALQREIVEHLVQRLGASDIRFEPAYRSTGSHSHFKAGDSEEFTRHFLSAEDAAARLGASLSFSGVRLDELHGPYCNVLRNVLHLTPDGSATNCFCTPDGTSALGKSAVIGQMDDSGNRFILDHGKIAALRRKANPIPFDCRDCLCAYHCVRECPDVCAVTRNPASRSAGGFRCRVARSLCEAWILKAASRGQPENRSPLAFCRESKERSGICSALDGLLVRLPNGIDPQRIREEYDRSQRFFRIESCSLPKPVWAERGFEQGSSEAWEIIQNTIPNRRESGPTSVYLHLPFCERRCSFCDCYAVPSNLHCRSVRELPFARTLLQEIECWSGIPGLFSRKTTTIHFGGGTPNHLTWSLFTAIVHACRTCLPTDASTEWALESTCRLLDDRHLHLLWEAGFTRLHAGVQTLEAPVRRLIGRQDPPEGVVEKLLQAVQGGFVVSVDLVYGLPGQTMDGLVSTVLKLADVGVHGFSLYRFQRTQRNRGLWSMQQNPQGDRLLEYLLFQCAEQILASRGYRKNHFAHFARPEDTNLYYRHSRRGEDLIALGPTADGIIGPYRYRHPELKGYLTTRNGKQPALEGGMWESESERRLRPLEASLMAAEIDSRLLGESGIAGLIENWQEAGLVRAASETGIWTLTASGSWFISEMLKQIRSAAPAGRTHPYGSN